jgi:hypothetical protein
LPNTLKMALTLILCQWHYQLHFYDTLLMPLCIKPFANGTANDTANDTATLLMTLLRTHCLTLLMTICLWHFVNDTTNNTDTSPITLPMTLLMTFWPFVFFVLNGCFTCKLRIAR